MNSYRSRHSLHRFVALGIAASVPGLVREKSAYSAWLDFEPLLRRLCIQAAPLSDKLYLRLKKKFHAHGSGDANNFPTGKANLLKLVKRARASAVVDFAILASATSMVNAKRSSFSSERIKMPSRNMNEWRLTWPPVPDGARDRHAQYCIFMG